MLEVSLIKEALNDLGIRQGDHLLVHSSYKSLGKVEGGPEAFIDALLEAVGELGHVMMPAFNYSSNIPEPYFDPDTTVSRTGVLCELLRKREQAYRSAHPSHSITVIGPKAREWTKGHLETEAFGVGSPIDHLVQANGKVLLIGVGHTSNSCVHIAEQIAKLPKELPSNAIDEAKVLMGDKIVSYRMEPSASCSAAFGRVEHDLRKENLIKDFRLGLALAQLFPAKESLNALVGQLQRDPTRYLCNWEGCQRCVITRKKLAV